MSWGIVLSILILAVAFIIKMPIGVGMIISSVAYMVAIGGDPSQIIEVICGKVAGNYIVLAVPLFVFTANLMNSSKITDEVFEFAKRIAGRWHGGLGQVNVIASLIFSGMTGAAVCDASGLGIIEIESMKKAGYDLPFSAAITATSAVIGPIFPPSIPFVLYGLIANVSIGKLFIAGMIPGIMIALVLLLYVSFISHKRNYPKDAPCTFREFIRITFHALPALMMPVVLLGGIYSGIMTATEAAAIAAFYSLLVALFVYRSLSWKEFVRVLKDSVKTSGQIGIMLAGAYGITYIMALSGLPMIVGEFIAGLVSSKYGFLIIVNVTLLILGMLMDTQVITLLTLPILVPIARQYGIDLVHFGLIFTLNLMIGLCTPPYGMLLFIVTGVSGAKMSLVIKETLPMLVVMIVLLLFLTYVPQSFMWLPQMIMIK